MKVTLKRSATAVIAGALAIAILPAEQVSAAHWARQHLYVPDGPRAGELWDDSLTPYIAEPLEMCSTDSGINEIAIRKSAQTGFTTLIIAATGHLIDIDPCRAMIVQPTSGALKEFNSDKLTIAIQNSPRLKALVRDQASRSGDGSTVLSKRFRGGSLKLAIANSAADLIPTVSEFDSRRGSHRPANLNLFPKLEVCDGFSDFFAIGLRRSQVAASGSADTRC